ncbi:MAG TPA: hypothetical protein H9736_03205 [Candidatus Anaerotruncus excrementipullorum]|uniref:Uncharacterized protein n=1 Tax=Candidatus Anaerotruncus excrementipullorum TaxID=2838465 RepID=A0A9D1WQW3_9FIRM|nr:hypothetical protein [Candidatus Anaerotruncus excrementipullorum]
MEKTCSLRRMLQELYGQPPPPGVLEAMLARILAAVKKFPKQENPKPPGGV